MSQWLVTTKDFTAVVEAESQHEAYNALFSEPLKNFGLVVTAQSLEPDGDEYSIRTSLLFHNWGMPSMAMFALRQATEKLGIERDDYTLLPEWNEDAWNWLDGPGTIDVEALFAALQRKAKEQPHD